jgi:hypothetical protein
VILIQNFPSLLWEEVDIESEEYNRQSNATAEYSLFQVVFITANFYNSIAISAFYPLKYIFLYAVITIACSGAQ